MRFILYLNLPAIIVILCLTPRQGRSKNSLPYTVILLMKPEESRRSQLYLASNNISIKNIGIIHNREFEEGVLRIEFYDESSSSKASALLKKYRYIVYEV